MNHFDVIVIGAGPGGYTTAAELSQNNLKVALVEKAAFGGTCVNYGCIPTKTLLSSVKKLNELKHFENFGLHGKFRQARANFQEIQEQRKTVTERLNGAISGALSGAGVAVFHGEAHVIDQKSLEVNGEVLEFDKLVLATGSRNRFLELEGFQAGYEVGVLGDSDYFLTLEELPKTIAIVGGGPISVEFAYFFASLNVKVAILQDMETLIPQFDKSIIKVVTEELETLNVDIYTSVQVKKLTNDYSLVFEQDGKLKKLTAEKYLISVGRVANDEAFTNLNLERNERNHLLMRDSQQTSLDHVYALGDVASPLQLSNVAYTQGSVVVRSILNKNYRPVNLNNVPYALYLNPEVAAVGSTEQKLERDYADQYVAVEIPAGQLPRNHAEQKTSLGFFKILVDKKDHKILGAHIVLLDASLIINEIALAMNNNLTIHDLAATAHTHPTLSEAVYYSSRAISLNLS